MISTLKREGHEPGQLNLPYPDKSLEKLRQQHNELAILNQLLSQKIQEFLKDDQLT